MGQSHDDRRDAAVMERVAAIANDVLRAHGAGFTAARRAGGYTNATWIGSGVVVRVAVNAGSSDLLREVRLVSVLPAEVGYPEVIDAGVTDGHEWVVARQVPGSSLSEAWPTMDWTQRVTAVRQLWELAEAVHATDVVAAAPHARSSSPFYAGSRDEAAESLSRLAAAELLSEAQIGELLGALDEFWGALPSARRVLVHGDLSPVNALWNGTRVVSLLDFEFAVIAPVELDLNELVKVGYAPQRGDTVVSTGKEALREAVMQIVAASASGRSWRELLIGYSVLLESWLAENEMTASDGVSPAADWESIRLLTALAAGDGGYYQPLLRAK